MIGISKHYATRVRRLHPLGSRWGRLVVTGYERRPSGCWTVVCRCDCGRTKKVTKPDCMRRGMVQSCGCLNRELSSKRRKGKAPIGQLAPGEASFNFLYRTYRKNALIRELNFELTPDEFKALVMEKCAYCGAPPTNHIGPKHYNGCFTWNGIDRVNPGLGYQPENVVPCCKTCNLAKRGMTLEEFVQWLLRVKKHLSL